MHRISAMVFGVMLLVTVLEMIGAPIPVTQAAVMVTGDGKSPLPQFVHNSAEHTNASRRIDSDRGTFFEGNDSWKLTYPVGTFGLGGLYEIPQNDSFGFYIEASGLLDIYVRILAGPGGSDASFRKIAFERLNNVLLAKIELSVGLGDPIGVEVETFCPQGDCFSQVFPYQTLLAVVSEPHMLALVLVGILPFAFRLRRTARAQRRRFA